MTLPNAVRNTSNCEDPILSGVIKPKVFKAEFIIAKDNVLFCHPGQGIFSPKALNQFNAGVRVFTKAVG
jgi:hypothetical protein